MTDHASVVLLELLVSHQADVFAVSQGDATATERIALTSRYSRASIADAAQLLSETAASFARPTTS